MSTNHPLMMGTEIKPYGRISAVGNLQGERYYWLTNDDGDVAMIPASMIEASVTTERRQP